MRRMFGLNGHARRSEGHATWVIQNPRDGTYLVLRLLDWGAAVGVSGEDADSGLPRYQISLTAVSPDLLRVAPETEALGDHAAAPRPMDSGEQARRLADSGLASLLWLREGNSVRQVLDEARSQLGAIADGQAAPAASAA